MMNEEIGHMSGFIARAQTDVGASGDDVWDALTDPTRIAVYMAGSKVTTTWRVGAAVTWDGEYDGHSYQDKGEVLIYDPPHVLSVTHYSPLMGQADKPENYHTLVYTLTALDGDRTHLELTQDGCASQEQATQFSQNWQSMLDGLKAHVEGRTRPDGKSGSGAESR